MENANKFREKIKRGFTCVGACITFTDATVTEALSGVLDFVWIDMEHGPLSLDVVQAHIIATKGTDTTPLVRVPWNDPVLIKPVLDIGAAGVIAPMVRTGDDARRLVAGCLYPPEGIRGFGPRRPGDYGRNFGASFCQAANAAIIPIAQIEHIDAINNIDEIIAVAGLAGILFGPSDLAGSMGHTGDPGHPDVLRAIDTALARARKTKLFIGMGVTDKPEAVQGWIDKGANWLCIPPDFMLLLNGAAQFVEVVRRSKAKTAR